MIKTMNKSAISFHTPVEKRHSTVYSGDSKRRLSFCDKPTPLDFDTFLPWVCLEWQVPEVITVTRLAQENTVQLRRHSDSSKSKSKKNDKFKEDDETVTKKGVSSTHTMATTDSYHTESSDAENAVPIKAYYDPHNHLVEIAIDGCVSALHRKVIQAINLCLPFHSFLHKLIIRKTTLKPILLHEISKLLPHSNITDICIDHTYVPEGNYFLLLDYASNLKYLSLNRCKINDDVCKEIAKRIHFGCPAEKSLAILDLSSNSISDIGAKHFGDMLRTNRHLLHLNLSGNEISDTGFVFLVRHLQEFPLTAEEIMDKRLRNLQYRRKKNEVYNNCLEEIAHVQKHDVSTSVPSEKGSSSTLKNPKFKNSNRPIEQETEQLPQDDLAEKMTKEILGEQNDPYDDDSIIVKDCYCHSKGNLKLCSLNVAYNYLEFLSLIKILEILSYQDRVSKAANTGLIRIVLEGNNFPNSCPELEEIHNHLRKVSSTQALLHTPLHTPLHAPHSHAQPSHAHHSHAHPIKRRTSFQSAKHR